ncbi:RNA methyltransferase [Streptococcus didelphis]|uniref:RNA methyltransferase n=1 Tax=Streptococcus didelphis TaxID=102886 RepID=A0ABY9LIB5_9STRE|nr:RNA methyltransferase [Streptococcus didelphis]WMB28568.1 RNA methyltransferase [Streptococcus didelphis]WMB30197.1 RNA methyltransferase [Streptococcus didelphis]
MKISSRTNPLIKQTKKLLTKKHRKHSYLIEGWHLVEEAKKSKQVFLHIFVLEEMVDQLVSLGITEDQAKLIVVAKEVLKELTDSPNPQGIIAEIAMPQLVLPETKEGKYLLLEDVQDPGNLGTIIRTAHAAKLDGVIISEKSADIYNQKTLRSMQGSHFHIPVWRTDVYAFCQRMKQKDMPILATTLAQHSITYKELPLTPNFVLVMGNEGNGISRQMAELATVLVHIDMPGKAESLNVAVAAGILIFSLI